MEVVIQWVTQIILFIVIATIIDLLIPAETMKRYVKLAVGLILLLILLKPIFHIFNTDIEKSIETSINQLEQENNLNETMENQIEFQKKEIQGTQHAYILEQMTVQLEDLAEEPLKEEYQAEITTMDYVFNDPEDISFEGLAEVIVYINEAQNGEGAVSTVEDVTVDPQQNEGESEKDIIGIEMLLKDVWELTDKKVSINWEGGTS
ncbi:stage III sporulation protein AF [Oceanobacillus massiliensis]|uniref:stage III sporulation protein AF n=1 Tax=Oceanobacillus massiliensis TaxID=1465765 RepID=UPI000287E935|nr:stage III sporulation protein AF [Oceanobacillus massiliensis]